MVIIRYNFAIFVKCFCQQHAEEKGILREGICQEFVVNNIFNGVEEFRPNYSAAIFKKNRSQVEKFQYGNESVGNQAKYLARISIEGVRRAFNARQHRHLTFSVTHVYN